MSAYPNENDTAAPSVKLTLVSGDKAEDPTVSSRISRFERDSYSDGSIAVRIGELATHAAQHYRDAMSGKQGEQLDLERLQKRREFAARAFVGFGMLSIVLNRDGPDMQRFAREEYDSAEREAESMSRMRAIDLIEARFNHPVIRAANSWARISGGSNEIMRDDAVLVTRAAAVILERISEDKYPEHLEL